MQSVPITRELISAWEYARDIAALCRLSSISDVGSISVQIYDHNEVIVGSIDLIPGDEVNLPSMFKRWPHLVLRDINQELAMEILKVEGFELPGLEG